MIQSVIYRNEVLIRPPALLPLTGAPANGLKARSLQ
jgi:hypothetical protein